MSPAQVPKTTVRTMSRPNPAAGRVSADEQEGGEAEPDVERAQRR